MNRYFHSLGRRAIPIFASAYLLQATGCAASDLISGAIPSIVASVINDFVFGAFGLV